MRELSWTLESTSSTRTGPRLGVLSIPSSADGEGTDQVTISTPACLTYTRRGEPAFLTPDVLNTLPPSAKAFQVSLPHFMDHLPSEHVSQCPGGGNKYFGSAPSFTLATARDSITFDLNSKPSNDDKSTFVGTPVGVKKLTVREYMKWVHAVQPSAFIALADEPLSLENVNVKKTKAAALRSERWLDECDALRNIEATEMSDGTSTSENMGIPMFACITGGACLTSRTESAAAAVAKGDSIFGYSIGGLGAGEDPNETRSKLLDVSIKQLPENKPRHVPGISAPLEVLCLLEHGIDVMDNSFCHTATVAGEALWFPVQEEEEDGDDDNATEKETNKKRKLDTDTSTTLADAAADAIDAQLATGTDAFTFNIWSLAYRTDSRPLVINCKCHTCRNHTRSYLHHLLQCREMTASVLLDIHNQYHYLLFFEKAREAIGKGTFEAFAKFHRSRADKGVSYTQ